MKGIIRIWGFLIATYKPTVCALAIVIGLPLLFLLEPFLNHYKNKAVVGSVSRMLQGQVSMLCSLLHDLSAGHLFHCYSLDTANMNIFDGMVLQLIILISMIPLVDSFDYVRLIFPPENDEVRTYLYSYSNAESVYQKR